MRSISRASIINIILFLATVAAVTAQQQGLNPLPPNAPSQKPAFAEQTRAPERKTSVAFDVVPVAIGLQYPWGMAFLPDGRILVTEKQPGQLRIVSPDGKLSEPVAGLPAVDARNQGGLLDVALDPAFAKNRLIYGATPSRARMASTIVPSPAAASMHRLRRRAWTRSA